MKICVYGLWHLGSVTAACLASVGHDVIGFDCETEVVNKLASGKAPLFEPGLDDLLLKVVASKKLIFTTNPKLALNNDVDILWVTFDTPVDEEDHADLIFIERKIHFALPFLCINAVVLVSSQLPVGSIKKLEIFAALNFPEKNLNFAYSPENLRLGKAIDVFLKPDRIVVGVRNNHSRDAIYKLLIPITNNVVFMSVESAEMTKHAINAFLAVSVTFANEIASLCELVGADAKEVEHGMKTEIRIGPKSYLSPGGPFAGGTLARDINFLTLASESLLLSVPLISAVRISNNEHKKWVQRKLVQVFGELDGVKVTVWGLTYKPGTDTIRRSLSLELCIWLLQQGAIVSVYDPAVNQLPQYLSVKKIRHFAVALDAIKDADVLVVGTDWPIFKQLAIDLPSKCESDLTIIDANRHIQEQIKNKGFNYFAVGTGGINEKKNAKIINR